MKREDGSHGSRGPRDIQDQIITYLTDEMDPPDRAAFERAMQTDEALRLEVETCRASLDLAREWALEPPPGRERVGELSAPQLPVTLHICDRTAQPGPLRSIQPMGRTLWRALAAAAIFVLGFSVGRWPADQSGTPHREPAVATATPAAPGAGANAVTGLAWDGPSPTRAAATPSPAPVATESPAVTDDAESQPCAPAVSTERDGRVIVETTLCKTGGRATWVVDGGFQLAQNTLTR